MVLKLEPVADFPDSTRWSTRPIGRVQVRNNTVGGWKRVSLDLGQIGGKTRNIDKRDVSGGSGGVSGVPMGGSNPRRVPIIKPVSGVPKIRQPIRTGDVTLPTKAPGAIGPPFTLPIPTPSKSLPILHPRILTPPPKPAPKKTGTELFLDNLFKLIKPEQTNMSLDLGSLASQVITGATNVALSRYAQPVYDPQGFNPFSEVPLNQFGWSDPGNSAAIGGAMSGTCLPPGYKYDKCGNVVKTRRRRRRRLATSSDIKDLAALTAVTNPAEKKTWIATHPS